MTLHARSQRDGAFARRARPFDEPAGHGSEHGGTNTKSVGLDHNPGAVLDEGPFLYLGRLVWGGCRD